MRPFLYPLRGYAVPYASTRSATICRCCREGNKAPRYLATLYIIDCSKAFLTAYGPLIN